MSGHEAIAVASLLQFADTLQLNLRAAIKEDADWHGRFVPLSDVVTLQNSSTYDEIQ